MNIITKLPSVPAKIDSVQGWVENEVLSSLDRLQKSKITGLLMHDPSQLTSGYGMKIYEQLKALKKRGLIENIGISIYSPSELKPILDVYNLDIVQAPFNVFDRRILEREPIELMKKFDISLHVRSVFLQGLLLKNNRPVYFNKWGKHFEKWDAWINNSKQTALEVCLHYALSRKEICKVIIGVDSYAQLLEIIKLKNKKSIKNPPKFAIRDKDLIDPSRWPK